MEKEKNTKSVEANQLKELVIIMAIVVIVFAIFYGITLLINKGDSKKEDVVYTDDAVIQYKEILVGEILNRKPTTYYVIAMDSDDMNVELYSYYLSTLGSDYYIIDLSNSFNKQFNTGTSYIKGKDTSKFTFEGTTLIKVNKGTVSEVYTDKTKIIEILEK